MDDKVQRFASLRQQAAYIDSLDMYLRACRRRGTTDEEALQAYRSAVRKYKRSLASLGPDVLFEYASTTGGPRQVW